MLRAFATLRARLLLLVLIALAPMFGLVVHNADDQRRAATAEARESVAHVARSTAAGQAELLFDAHQLLLTLARLPEIRDPRSPLCEPLLRDLLALHPGYDDLAVAGFDGAQLCGALPVSGPVNVADRAYFQRALATSDFSVGDLQLDLSAGKAMIVAAHPLIDDAGQPSGVVYGSLDLGWVGQLAATSHLPDGAALTIVDRAYTVFARYPDTGRAIGEAADYPASVKAALDREQLGTTEAVGADGVPRLYSFAFLPAQPNEQAAYAIVEMPAALVYASASDGLERNLISLGIVALIALTAAWIAANALLLRWVRTLLIGTKLLAAGEQNVRLSAYRWPTELLPVAHSFDVMAATLEQREGALRESELKYRTLVEHMPAVTYVASPSGEGPTLYISPQIEGLLGFTPAEWLADAAFWTNHVHPDDLPVVREQVARTHVGDTFSSEYRLAAGDGRWVWVRDEGTAIKDGIGKPALIQGVMIDITERKLAGEALRESEARYRELADSLPETVFELDTSGYLMYANRAAYERFGFTEDDFAKGLLGLDLVVPEEREKAMHTLAARLRGEARDLEEFNVIGAGGKVFPAVIYANRRLSEGRPAGLSGFLVDISQRKEAEERVAREAARSEALLRVAGRLNAQLDLRTVLDAICEEAARALGTPIALVGLHDKASQVIEIAAACGLPGSGPYRAIPSNVLEEYAGNRGAFVIPDVRIIPPPHGPLPSSGVRTMVVSRMRRDGELVGILSAVTLDEIRAFTSDELALLEGLADQAAQAIVNSRLHAENLRQVETLSALFGMARKLSGSLNVAQLAAEIVRAAVEDFGVEVAALTRIMPDGRLVPIAHLTAPDDTAMARVISLLHESGNNGLTSRAVCEGKVILVDEISEGEEGSWEAAAHVSGLRSLATMPLTSRGRTFGCFMLFSAQPDFFNGNAMAFFETLSHLASSALENAQLYEHAERRLHELQALRNIDRAITGSLDLNVTISVFLEQVVAQLEVDAAAVLMLNPFTQTLVPIATRGCRGTEVSQCRVGIGECIAGRAVVERRMVATGNLAHAQDCPHGFLASEGFVSSFTVPLIAKGRVQGVLHVLHRSLLEPDAEWLQFLEALAGQAAIAVDNAALFNDLERSNMELILAYDATIEGWSRALDLRDNETEGHSQRVTELTERLGRVLGMTDADVAHARRGALLHDIGKMAIPDRILLKPGPLTQEEWHIMRMHPQFAFDLLAPIAFLRPAIHIPYAHHERWDGQGYPRGLRGEQIPLPARIFAIVDVWDALRSDRPYRSAWPEDKVRSHLASLAGTHFEARIVEAFLALI